MRESLFGVHQIPCDNQIPDLLDGVEPQCVFPVFEEILRVLDEAAKRWLTTHAQTYRSHRITVLGDDLYCHEMRVAVMAEKFERVRTLG
jgi:hypothetical protein